MSSSKAPKAEERHSTPSSDKSSSSSKSSVNRRGKNKLAEDSSLTGEDEEERSELPGVTNSEWTQEEQSKLQDALKKQPKDKFSTQLERFVHIASLLPSKTARDVALRVKWLSLRENARRSNDATRKQTKTANRVSSFNTCGNIASVPLPSSNSNDSWQSQVPAKYLASFPGMLGGSLISDPAIKVDDASKGSTTSTNSASGVANLLEHNYILLSQIKENMSTFKVLENMEILGRYRDNLLTLINQITTMPGSMGQLPELPVQPNTDLAAHFLPPVKPSADTPAYFPALSPLPRHPCSLHRTHSMPALIPAGALPCGFLPTSTISSPVDNPVPVQAMSTAVIEVAAGGAAASGKFKVSSGMPQVGSLANGGQQPAAVSLPSPNTATITEKDNLVKPDKGNQSLPSSATVS